MDHEFNLLKAAGLKPMMIAASFFYHNDRPDGQGIEFFMFDWPIEGRERMAKTFSTEAMQKYCLNMIKETGSKTNAINVLTHQLDMMRRPRKLGTEESILFALNVSALVMFGALEQSEYNGNQFMWEGIPT